MPKPDKPVVTVTQKPGKGIPDEVAQIMGKHNKPLSAKEEKILEKAFDKGQIDGYNLSFHDPDEDE